MIRATFTSMGRDSQPLNLPEGTTLECLKETLDINPGLVIMLRGEKIADDYEVTDGDNFVAVTNVKGGIA